MKEWKLYKIALHFASPSVVLPDSIIIHITTLHKHIAMTLPKCSFTRLMAVFRYLGSQYLPPVSRFWCAELITQMVGYNNRFALLDNSIKNTQFAIEKAASFYLLIIFDKIHSQ